MKNIAIIGHSPAAYLAVKFLLERDPSLGLTLISADGQLPYDRTLLPGLIDRSVKEKNIFCAGEDFYAASQVQVVLDKEISRINFTRNRIYGTDRVAEVKVPANKAQYDFDTLILLDSPQVRLPQIKGVRRQGVFHLATLRTVKDLIRYLPFTETVVVEPRGFSGIRAALALKAVGKDVIIASRHEALLSDVISVPRSGELVAALEKRGVRVMYSGGAVEDVIGENEVKAVRFKAGKVVACDMIILEDAVADLRFLSDTGISMSERILTSVNGLTNIPGVYAADVVAEIPELGMTGGYWVSTEIGGIQAGVVAGALFGEDRILVRDDFSPRDMTGTFFHPQEIHQDQTEGVV
ncbi:MAG: FAD-dependent oxidoreductase [Candidatus Omnitrophota bacterium]